MMIDEQLSLQDGVMYIIGIDLSGPSNTADTVLTSFRRDDSVLRLHQSIIGASDMQILEFITDHTSGTVAVGIDAPLSYNPGGGHRPFDSDLQRNVIAAGLHAGSVMPPTLNRMAYLTLRGISVARMLQSIQINRPRIVEVHPGAAMALRHAPIDLVRMFKRNDTARIQLLEWLEQQGLRFTSIATDPSDHYVAACAAAFVTWKWKEEKTVWLHGAEPPLHPFDFAC